jgi:uncharacterized protein YaaQ
MGTWRTLRHLKGISRHGRTSSKRYSAAELASTGGNHVVTAGVWLTFGQVKKELAAVQQDIQQEKRTRKRLSQEESDTTHVPQVGLRRRWQD